MTKYLSITGIFLLAEVLYKLNLLQNDGDKSSCPTFLDKIMVYFFSLRGVKGTWKWGEKKKDQNVI